MTALGWVCVALVVLALAYAPFVLSGTLSQREEDEHGVDKARRS